MGEKELVKGETVYIDENDVNLFFILDTGFTIVISKDFLFSEVVTRKVIKELNK